MRVLLLVLALATAAHAGGPVRKVLLKNGFRLVTAPDASLPLVGVCLSVGAGPAQEDASTGGASQILGLSMLELPEGHALKKEYAKAVEMSGNDSAVTAQKDITQLTLEVPVDRLDTVLRVLAERVREPGANLANADEIKARLLRRHTGRAEHPLSQGKLGARFEEVAYGAHPYARSPDGTPESLKGLTREKIAEFQRKWWAPNNIVLSLTGDVDTDKILPRVQELFGALPAAPLVRAAPPEVALPDAPRKDVLELPVDSTALEVGWIGPPAQSPDAFAVRLVRAVLAEGQTSRLHRRVVDRGARATSLDSSSQLPAQNGYVEFHFSLASPDVWPVVDDVVSEVERLRRAEVGPEELARAKTLLASQDAQRREVRGSWAERLAEFELIDEVYTAESYSAQIEQVTAAQVKAAAVKWFDPQRMIVVAIRPPSGPAASGPLTETFQLPGGLTLAVRSRSGSDSAGVCALVKTGTSSAVPKVLAASTLGARLLGSTAQRSSAEMAVALEALGTKLRTSAQQSHVSVLLTATTDTLDDVLSHLREMLMEPKILPADLARHRSQLVAELRESTADDDARGQLELQKEVYPGTGDVVAMADPELMLQLNAEDMSRWFAETLVPARTVISISSALPAARVRDLVAAKFAGWNAPGAPLPAPKPLVAFEKREVRRVASARDRASDAVFVAFRLPPDTNREFAAMTVCVRALGVGKQALLWKHVAKVDPAYQPLGFSYHLRDTGGVVSIGLRVERGKADAALAALDAACKELADPGPAESEVADTRDFVLNIFLKEQQQRVIEAGTLAIATGSLNDPRFFADMAPRYKAVTQADVKRAAGSFSAYHAVVFEAAK